MFGALFDKSPLIIYPLVGLRLRHMPGVDDALLTALGEAVATASRGPAFNTLEVWDCPAVSDTGVAGAWRGVHEGVCHVALGSLPRVGPATLALV